MDHGDITRILVHEFGYEPRSAQTIAKRLLSSRPEVQEAFQLWRLAIYGKAAHIVRGGFTVDRLMREHSMKPVAALLTLDWLAREPERAAASLRKEHDTVGTRPHDRPRHGPTP